MWVGIEAGTEESTLESRRTGTIHSSRFYQKDVVSSGVVIGGTPQGLAYGGGVFQTVALTLSHTQLIGNTATITGDGLQASAGALYAGAGAQTELLDCALQLNDAGGTGRYHHNMDTAFFGGSFGVKWTIFCCCICCYLPDFERLMRPSRKCCPFQSQN